MAGLVILSILNQLPGRFLVGPECAPPGFHAEEKRRRTTQNKPQGRHFEKLLFRHTSFDAGDHMGADVVGVGIAGYVYRHMDDLFRFSVEVTFFNIRELKPALVVLHILGVGFVHDLMNTEMKAPSLVSTRLEVVARFFNFIFFGHLFFPVLLLLPMNLLH